MNAADELTRLLGIMAALRDPVTGCPWDQVQDFDSIAPYTIEEAYEVADAIARRDWVALPDELGDLLLQIVYYASMAETEGRFDFATIARSIADKMVRRHPHVFGDVLAPDLRDAWEAAKLGERRARSEHGTLAGIPIDLPALLRSSKLCARAARVGFDWPEPAQVLDKLDEELAELRAELGEADPARLQDELGDVLFTTANLARKLGLNPETCLRQANAKFQRRFEAMERIVETGGRSLADASLEEMEAGWQTVKRQERDDGSQP
ncbi:MAG: nucleoside triphosphate pyrophosphohydrolase [Janthinobacterium lividum]